MESNNWIHSLMTKRPFKKKLYKKKINFTIIHRIKILNNNSLKYIFKNNFLFFN